METCLLLTLTILCALHWLIIMTRDVTRDRTGPAMLIEGAAVLRDVAKFLAASGTSRIEVGQQDVSQHGQNDDSCHYQCHAVYGRLQGHSSNRLRWISPTSLALFPNCPFFAFLLLSPSSRITDLGHNRILLAIHDRRSWWSLTVLEKYTSKRLHARGAKRIAGFYYVSYNL